MLSRKLSILLLLVSSCIFAQNEQKEIKIEQYAEIAIGNSYITFPTDIGNIAPLWFEGNIKPNFIIRQSKTSRLTGVITPQIILRMFQEKSYPVRTPSYMPQISAYYQTDFFETLSPVLLTRIGHHSNGQDGEFLLPSGKINKISGNFATNYIEFGFLKPFYNNYSEAHQVLSTTLEIHPKQWIIKELRQNYGRYRWRNTLKIFKLQEKNAITSTTIFSIDAEITCLMGRIDGVKVLSGDRIIGKLTLNYHPSFLKEVGFFFQLYHGRDYYNIYFDDVLNIVRFGIMTNKLHF